MIKHFGWFLLGLTLLFSNSTFAQSNSELTPGYYLTVGAYAKEKERYAQRFVEILQQKGYQAGYGLNANNNLFLVYIEVFSDLKQSIQKMLAVRNEGEFTDAWIRVVPGYITTQSLTQNQNAQQIDSQERSVEKMQETNKPSVESNNTAEKKSDMVIDEVLSDSTQEEEIVQYDPMTLGNTEVFFSLFNATNNRIVEGKVQVIDAERAKLIKELAGNDYVMLPDPKSSTQQVSLIADVFGYRKIQHEFNYKAPLSDTAKDYVDLMGTTFVVYFDLVRYRKGDISTLYNVYFYNDAALMLPTSKYELNSLLDMMKENPNYRIRLHGHTNGNYHGKVITLGPDKNFFSLDGAKQTVGSAKDLSFQRAQTIKEYLMANGIDESRMEVKAWGGKRPIYDKHSANAKKNVRVEVEVLAE